MTKFLFRKKTFYFKITALSQYSYSVSSAIKNKKIDANYKQ